MKGMKRINLIWTLAQKHNTSLFANNWEDLAIYDDTGAHGFNAFLMMSETVTHERELRLGLWSTSVESRPLHKGLRLSGEQYEGKYAPAPKYYEVDWEHAQRPS
ncbi:hypothetical protein FRB98_007978 [Tulasnella sp. 332]|nr:hypothetical protein FRB98_007978 [Tulasnella sp. 332]